MVLIGVLVTLFGFLVSVMSLQIAHSVGGRMIIVLIGLAVSLFGIIGLINAAYLKKAIWKR